MCGWVLGQPFPEVSNAEKQRAGAEWFLAPIPQPSSPAVGPLRKFAARKPVLLLSSQLPLASVFAGSCFSAGRDYGFAPLSLGFTQAPPFLIRVLCCASVGALVGHGGEGSRWGKKLLV